MADIAASDVVYALVDESIDSGSGYRSGVYTLTFGDGALTYGNAAGGVPLTIANLGCPNFLIDFIFLEAHAENGFIYKWDESSANILIYETAAVSTNTHTHALHFNDADVSDGATTRINAGTNLLGGNTGADIAVAGVTGTTGAGGIVQAAALTQVVGALSELTASATPAEAVLRVRARGW